MVNRILALVAAVAMIVGALAFRSMRTSSSSSSDGSPAATGGSGQVVCAQELGDAVCSSLPEGRVVEPASTTATRLLKARDAADAGVAVWLAPGPWAEMVDAGRQGRPPLFSTPKRLGRTPLVAIARKGQLPAGCGGTATWKCITDASQDPKFRVAGDRAEGTAVFTRAAVAGAFLGRTDYATNDLDDVASNVSGFDRSLDAGAGFGATSVADFLVKQGSAALFLTTGAAAAAAPSAAFDVFPPTPATAISAELATTSLKSGHPVDQPSVIKALTAGGWQAPGTAATEGLPSPGVLLALREASS